MKVMEARAAADLCHAVKVLTEKNKPERRKKKTGWGGGGMWGEKHTSAGHGDAYF